MVQMFVWTINLRYNGTFVCVCVCVCASHQYLSAPFFAGRAWPRYDRSFWLWGRSISSLRMFLCGFMSFLMLDGFSCCMAWLLTWGAIIIKIIFWKHFFASQNKTWITNLDDTIARFQYLRCRANSSHVSDCAYCRPIKFESKIRLCVHIGTLWI